MKTACQRCGAEWGGMRTEHCKNCHRTFTGTTAGDMHRTGDYGATDGANRRRCRTEDEMRERGMTINGFGVWTAGGDNPWKRTADHTGAKP